MHTVVVNNNQLIKDSKGISRYYFSLEHTLSKRFNMQMLFDKPASGPFNRKIREQLAPLKRLEYDLIWSISPTGPAMARNHVVTVHDLIPLHPDSGMSGLYKNYYKNSLLLLLKKSQHIVCISSTVADLVQVYYGIKSQKITVIRNGYDLIKNNSLGDARADNPISGNYFLFVGTFSKHKNLTRLIEAFALFKKETKSDLSLVIAGHFPTSKGGLAAVTIDFDSLKSAGIQFVNGPTDASLDLLYRNSSGVIMPSLIEGFGLPISEALSYGKPVACSDITVFRELFSGMIRSYFNPHDTESMANSIKILAASESALNVRESETYREVGTWTWAKASDDYEKLFNKLSHSKS